MSIRRIFFFVLVAIALLLATGVQTTSLINSNDNTDNTVELLAGRNVNMVSGTMLPLGDPWLQRQNEPSIAVSSRNPMHLFAAANDYRTIDMPDDYEVRGIPGVAAGRDAWIGIFQSFDGGESWVSMLLPGFPQDASQGASNEGLASPIYGFDTACDPRVCAGAEGLFYVSGIAFMRNQLAGTVFVARYVDLNNRETIEEVTDPITEQREYVGPIEYMDTWIAGVGNPGQFIDMPNMAVDVPRDDAPFGNVHLAYTVFLGNTGLNIRSRIVFVTSRDGGVTWGKPIKVTESQHIIQRPVIAIDPSDPTGNTIYVVFRRFAHRQTPGGIAFVKSIDGGMSFTKPADVAPLLCPFDQWTKGPTITSLRTNSYPTMAIEVVDGNGVPKGVPYVAWAQRYDQDGNLNPDGQARIVFSYSENGGIDWSYPQLVDPYYTGDGHQFMPSITCAGGNKTVIWYDQRDDIALHDPDIFHDPYEKFIEDVTDDHRHTIDVRAAEAPVGSPIFGSSILLSRYLFFMQLDEDGNPYPPCEDCDPFLWQGQFNYSGLPLFHLGTKPFQGDYIEVVSSPHILPPSAPSSNSWVFNTDPLEPTRSHGVWTDTRDVWPPAGDLFGNWITYTPPNSVQDTGFEQENPCNPDIDTTGMRNQNIYTADLNHGIIVGSPGNSKQLNTQRAFVVFVKNTTENKKLLNLTIIPSEGVSASFEQFTPTKSSLVVTVLPYSSVSSTVYVEENSNRFAPVRVDITENSTLVGRVYLNPDSTDNPLLGPDGKPLFEESHRPGMRNPKIWKYHVGNQNEPNASFLSPRAQNPRAQNSGYINPRAQNPRAQNPRAQNPRAQNPRAQNENIVNNEMLNPRAQNPRAQNTALTDMTWTITNDGNTTSAYSFNIASDSPDDINAAFDAEYEQSLIAQVLVYKTHMVPIDKECVLFQTHADALIVNFTNPRAQNPRVQNGSETSSNITTLGMSSTEQNDIVEPITFYLAPGEEAEVILRVYDPNTEEGNSFDDYINDIGGETEAEAADTNETEPKWAEQPDAPWGEDPSYLPEIGTSSTSLSFAAVLEVNPDDQILRIYNTGEGTLNYTIADDADWLSVWPLEEASEEPDDGYDKKDHTVSVNVSGLALGTYLGTITITDPYATNNPLRVPVTLTIVLPPPHTVSTPNIPSGTTNGVPDISYTYSTGGSVCSWEDSVEYMFDWGDGNQSTWSSSTNASHTWDSASTYNVKAQARCSSDTNVVSAWSDALTVTINEPIFEIAYVYSTDTTTANSYKDFLEGKDYPTNLIHMDSIVTGMFADYGLILIGTDTGYTRTWGDSGKVAAVNDSGKPIIGLGEGGYAFFGKLILAIGWGHGYHGSITEIIVVDSSHDVFNTPNNLGVSTDQTISIYSPTGNVGIYLPAPPENVVLLGREVTNPNHYPLVQEDERYLLWGWTASPDSMTQMGKDLFENVVSWFAFFYPDFYAVDSLYDGLYIVESVSGNVTFIGPLDSDPNKYVTPISMAVRPADGTIYVWNNSDEDGAGKSVPTGVLLTVNPSTGLATEVNPNALNQGTLAALAFAPDGTLYGIKHDTAQELYTINLTTGVKTLVGNIGQKVYGADFYGEDLYGLTTSGNYPNYIQKLVKIDTSLGTVISEVQLDQNVGVVGSIVFDAFGRPTGSGSGSPHGRILYGIDLVSGHIFNIRQLSEEYLAQGLGLVF